MSLLKKITATAGVALAAGTLVATEAYATEGYFQNAIGARSKGMAGAGVANSKDATAITLNPAGLVHAGRQFNGSVSVFMPFREYQGQGSPFTVKSKKNIFLVPNMAYSQPYNDTTTLGISLSGNGGMNTTYGNDTGNIFGSKAGIDLTQVNISFGFGKQIGKYFSIGVAPILAVQRFKAYGLAGFAGSSVRPGNVTGRGYDYSFGGGVRFGAEWQLDDNIRIGASYQTKLLMSRFKKYSGLFAESGDFDIPSNFQIGVAFDVTPQLTLMADYRYINYSEIAAISNSISNFGIGGLLGANNGAGFGWKDVQTIKFGAEYAATDNLTIRAGYSYNTNPIPKTETIFNTLAPAVVQHHITAGGTFQFSENSAFEFAAAIVPTGKTKGGATSPFDIKMRQLEFTVGYNYVW